MPISPSKTESHKLIGKSQVRTRNRGPLLRDEALEGTLGPDQLEAGAGDDQVDGGTGADRLEGGDGADQLSGDQGDDVIEGGTGRDTLNGGSGGDYLNGGNNKDEIDGGKGADNLQGEQGDDLLNGDQGRDLIDGGEGNDVIDGGKGDDVVLAGRDSDSVEGGKGNDVLDGEDGNDSLSGGTGDDTLIAGKGNDTLTGGRGADLFDISEGDNVIEDFDIDAGDQLYLGDKEISETNQAEDGLELILSDNSQQLFVGVSLEEFNKNIEQILYEPPTLFGNPNTGNCTTLINDGQNNQTITLAEDENIKITMKGGDSTNSQNHHNYSYHADLIFTNKSKISWPTGAGAIKIAFSTPWKDYIGDGPYGMSSKSNGKGHDGRDYQFESYSWGFTPNGGTAGLFHVKNINSDTYTAPCNFAYKIGNGQWADLGDLGKSPEPDYSIIYGTNSDDTEDSTNATDQNGLEIDFLGTEGPNEMHGKAGNDRILSDQGDDKLFGDDGADLLNGGSQDDILRGGDGNDTLNGAQHSDQMYGGVGEDLFRLSNGPDTIHDFDKNEDLIRWFIKDEDGWRKEDIDIDTVDDGVKISGAENINTTVKGISLDDFTDPYPPIVDQDGNYIFKPREIIDGTKDDDRKGDYILQKDGQYEYFKGNQDLDTTLNGLEGNDELSGSSGNDHLDGGPGNDVLDGGKGDDYYDGGSGQDIFVASEGRDVIEEFNSKEGDTAEFPFGSDLTEFSRANIIDGNIDIPSELPGKFHSKWNKDSAIASYTIGNSSKTHTTYILNYESETDLDWDNDINIDELIAPGLIAAWEEEEAPEGWLILDGKEFNPEDYPILSKSLANPNKLPNFSGRFLVQQGEAKDLQAATSAKNSPAKLGEYLGYLTAKPKTLSASSESHSHRFGNSSSGGGGGENGAQPLTDNPSKITSTAPNHQHNLSYTGGAETTHPNAQAINWIIKHDYTGESTSEIVPKGIIFPYLGEAPQGWESEFSNDEYLVGSGRNDSSGKSFTLNNFYPHETADPVNPFTIEANGEHFHGVHAAHGGKGGGTPPMSLQKDYKTTEDGEHKHIVEAARIETRPDSINVNWIKKTDASTIIDGIDTLLPNGVIAAWLTDNLPNNWNAKASWEGRYLRGSNDSYGHYLSYQTDNPWMFSVSTTGKHFHKYAGGSNYPAGSGKTHKTNNEEKYETSTEYHNHLIRGGDRTTRPDSVVVNWAELGSDSIIDLCKDFEGEAVLKGNLKVASGIQYDARSINIGETARAGGPNLLEKYRADIRDGKLEKPQEGCAGLPIDSRYTMNGGSGDDHLAGGEKQDSLTGGEGQDFLEGRTGSDTLEGNEGKDFIYAGTGADWMDGGSGNDHLYGSSEYEDNEPKAFVLEKGQDVFFNFNLKKRLCYL